MIISIFNVVTETEIIKSVTTKEFEELVKDLCSIGSGLYEDMSTSIQVLED